jgi:hypothetical protein
MRSTHQEHEPESSWPELDAAIAATRKARDNSARAGQLAIASRLPILGDELNQLAADYDRLLANLLYVQRTPGSLHPNYRGPSTTAAPPRG